MENPADWKSAVPAGRTVQGFIMTRCSIISRCPIAHVKSMLRQTLEWRWLVVVLLLNLHFGCYLTTVLAGKVNAHRCVRVFFGNAALDVLDPAIFQCVADAGPLLWGEMQHFQNQPFLASIGQC